MTMIERMERIYRIAKLADLLANRQQTVGVFLNWRVVNPEPPPRLDSIGAQMNARAAAANQYGRPPTPPEPTGRWVAIIGQFEASSDDPEQSLRDLEAAVVSKAKSSWRQDVAERRQKLAESEALLRDIEAATSEAL